MSEITTEEHQLEMIRELGRVCENQEDTIHILRRQIAELEHGEKMWRGNANSVRRVCKDAGIPTHHGGHYEGIPRDLADPVKDIVAQRDRLRSALTPSATTKAAYIGEFSFDGPEGMVQVPWTTIKEIMEAILNQAK